MIFDSSIFSFEVCGASRVEDMVPVCGDYSELFSSFAFLLLTGCAYTVLNAAGMRKCHMGHDTPSRKPFETKQTPSFCEALLRLKSLARLKNRLNFFYPSVRTQQLSPTLRTVHTPRRRASHSHLSDRQARSGKALDAADFEAPTL